MNQRQALKKASFYVNISGHGTSWTVYSPYQDTKLNGPNTATNFDSFKKAKRYATLRRIEIALNLLHKWSDSLILDLEKAYHEKEFQFVARDILEELIQSTK